MRIATADQHADAREDTDKDADRDDAAEVVRRTLRGGPRQRLGRVSTLEDERVIEFDPHVLTSFLSGDVV